MTTVTLEKTGKDARSRIDPEVLLSEGRESLLSGDYKTARQRFRLALMYNMRLASKVALCYEEILTKDSSDVNARLALTDLHLYLGEPEGAISELEEILEIAPDRADVYTILGKLFIKQQDFDSAISVIEAAMAAGISDTGLSEMLAGSYVEKGRVDEAVALYKGLLEQDKHNKNYLRVLGELYTRTGDTEGAARSYYSMLDDDVSLIGEATYRLEELKKKEAGNCALKEIMADVYVKSMKPALAAGELEEVLKIGPKDLDRMHQEVRSRYWTSIPTSPPQ